MQQNCYMFVMIEQRNFNTTQLKMEQPISFKGILSNLLKIAGKLTKFCRSQIISVLRY